MVTVNKIQWIAPPSSENVGSVLVYRAADVSADAVGSRSIIATLDVGSISFTDTGGDPHSVYRIQFFDGTGSSPFSDSVIPESNFSEILATIDQVKRVARIPDNSDIGSAEIFDAIADATDEHWAGYGDPIKRTIVHLDSTGSAEYMISDNFEPVYQVRQVTSMVVEGPLVSGSDYDFDFNNAIIQFSSDFITNNQGENVWIQWIPKSSNIIVKNLAAMRLIEGVTIIEGREVESVEAKRLKNQIESMVDAARPKGAFTIDNLYNEYTKQVDESGMWADFIAQRINRQALKFST